MLFLEDFLDDEEETLDLDLNFLPTVLSLSGFGVLSDKTGDDSIGSVLIIVVDDDAVESVSSSLGCACFLRLLCRDPVLVEVEFCTPATKRRTK